MAEQVITLDHEYGGSAKIGFNPDNIKNNPEDKGLLPLPAKYKYQAILSAIESLSTDSSLSVEIKHGKNINTARINFNNLIAENNQVDEKLLTKIEQSIVTRVNLAIQPALKTIMAKDDLDYTNYYRTDTYFESSRQDNTIIINWKKVE